MTCSSSRIDLAARRLLSSIAGTRDAQVSAMALAHMRGAGKALMDAGAPLDDEDRAEAAARALDLAAMDRAVLSDHAVGEVDHATRGVDTLEDVSARNAAGGCSGLLIRASLFSEIGGFDERLPAMQDWDLWIRLIERQALHYSGIEGVVYDFGSTQKITHNLKAKYLGLRRLYFKHFDGSNRSVRQAHLVRAWALRQLLEPSGPRLFRCIMRILSWPKATIYYLKWYKFRNN